MENAVATPADANVDWLFRRGVINDRQLSAVRRLQNRREQHPDRYELDMAAIGPGLNEIVWRVVIAGNGLREAETALGWPARAGRIVLLLALDRLADRYASVDRSPEGGDRETGRHAEHESAVPSEASADAHPSAPSLQTPQGGDS